MKTQVEANMPSEWLSTELAEIVTWFERLAERGHYTPEQHRQWVTAMRRMQEPLTPEEAANIPWLVENMEQVAERFARLKGTPGSTARTYKTKAQNLLMDYLSSQKDPLNFKPKVSRLNKPKDEKAKEGKTAKALEVKQMEVAPPAPQAALFSIAPPLPKVGKEEEEEEVVSPPNFRDYPLSDGRVFTFRLPDSSFNARDLARIMLHLATLTADFDPLDENIGQLFALITRPKRGD